MLVGLVGIDPAHAAATPPQFGAVSAKAGPGPGEVTFTWSHTGADTTHFQLETATSQFSPSTTSTLPRVGRNQRFFTVDKSKRSLTLTASQLTEAGAPGGSGLHLLYRLYALNRSGGSETIRRFPTLQAVLPEPRVSADAGTDGLQIGALRVGSFNVRTSKADDDHTWLERRAGVAKLIAQHNPDVLALQELGPGRADGKSGSTSSSTGGTRQTLSLLNSLATIKATQYKLVRTTHYWASGTTHGTQGMRILYNSKTVTPLLSCPEKTGSSSWSASCTIKLPIRPGDSEKERVVAAYQKFKINLTGAQFYFVSVHLNSRHGTPTSTETSYSQLRTKQAQAALDGIAKINTSNLPVIMAGDTNSFQNLTSGDLVREKLAQLGYTDSASAPIRTNLQYSTYNGYEKTLKASSVGFAARLDGIFTHGALPLTYVNVTEGDRHGPPVRSQPGGIEPADS